MSSRTNFESSILKYSPYFYFTRNEPIYNYDIENYALNTTYIKEPVSSTIFLQPYTETYSDIIKKFNPSSIESHFKGSPPSEDGTGHKVYALVLPTENNYNPTKVMTDPLSGKVLVAYFLFFPIKVGSSVTVTQSYVEKFFDMDSDLRSIKTNLDKKNINPKNIIETYTKPSPRFEESFGQFEKVIYLYDKGIPAEVWFGFNNSISKYNYSTGNFIEIIGKAPKSSVMINSKLEKFGDHIKVYCAEGTHNFYSFKGEYIFSEDLLIKDEMEDYSLLISYNNMDYIYPDQWGDKISSTSTGSSMRWIIDTHLYGNYRLGSLTFSGKRLPGLSHFGLSSKGPLFINISDTYGDYILKLKEKGITWHTGVLSSNRPNEPLYADPISLFPEPETTTSTTDCSSGGSSTWVIILLIVVGILFLIYKYFYGENK